MRVLVILLGLAGAVCQSAFAADALPNFLNSNAIERNLPSPNLPAETYRPKTPELKVPEAQPRQTLQMGTQVLVRNVRIEGGSVYPIEELAELYRPLIGRESSMSELLEATRSITRRYQADGYLISYAFLPNQRFEDGLVRVVLVEGYIKDYQLQGELGAVQGYLEKLVAKMKGERPLTRATFERYTALMSRIPGVRVRAELPPPGTTDGAARLNVAAVREAWNSSLSFSDGNNSSGQALVTLTSNSHTSFGEQISLGALYPPGEDHERYLRFDYGQYLSSEGTRLNLFASSYRSDPSDNLRLTNGLELERRRSSDRLSLGVSHPFVATATSWLSGTVRLYGVDDSTHYRGVGFPLSIKDETDIRVLALEADWRQSNAQRFRIVSGGLYRGLNTLGAKTENDLFDLEFTRMNLYAMQSDKFGERWQGVLSGALYWSEDNLPDAEQAIFGGQNFGRGYPNDQASGDKGWGVGYELGYSFTLENKWLSLLQPYVAVDAARAWFNEQPVRHSELSSAALGIRFGDARYYNISLEAAKPMADKALDSNNRNPRLTVSFSYQL